jgi:arylsulfatase A-like enzyme
MKCNLTDHGIGVMLVMRGPGGYTGGKVIDGMVSQIDIFPTICELLGLEKPDWLQGKSFQPLVAGDAPRVNEEIFAEVNYHAAYEPQRCVRTERWKYIRRFLDRPTPVVCNTDGSPSRNVWMEHGFPDRPVAKEQLYDLLFDPNEGNNLAGRETHASVLEEMRERLHAWMEHTNDPLLKGDVPAPPGATVNEQDSHSSRSKTRSAGRK